MEVELEHKGMGPFTLFKRFEPEIYQYRVQMEDDGIPGNIIQWCLSNCEGKWSWYFHNGFAWMSFDNHTDHLIFALKMR